MSVYADYTADEQQLLRRSLQAAAVAISAASPGRGEETVSEGFAAASRIMGSLPEHVGSTLVTSVIVALQGMVADQHEFPDYVEAARAPGVLEDALEALGDVAALLDDKDPEEAASYKGWLLDIARATAEAGKEDQGFLGRGGVMVNDAEQAALGSVAAALGVDLSPP